MMGAGRLLLALGVVMSFGVANAADVNPYDNPDFISVEQILSRTVDEDTTCSTAVFARALADNSGDVSEDASEPDVEQWVHAVFSKPDVLRAVVACPEIANSDELKTVNFLPIQYTFPGGRQLVINYSTQPRILSQRLLLAGKRSVVDNDNPSPAIGEFEGGAIWTNTDPAWYAIMVVESGGLRDFVGPDKNNTVSVKYINDNIDDLYPSGYTCTSKSAFANDKFAINRAVTKTVGMYEATGEKDSNDYYVAGDVNLEWISYAEIALDVVLTVVTAGGSTVILGASKAARASKTAKNLTKTMRELRKLDSVKDYIRTTSNYARAAEELSKIDRATDAARYAAKAREVDNLRDTIRTMETVDDVKKYRDASNAFSELNAYRHSMRGLRAIRSARRGNVMTRLWRAAKSANSGGKMLDRTAKIARSSMKSGQVRDWLFHSTMRNAGMVMRMEQMGGLMYGVLKFGLDMYDYTTDSTDEYTSGLDFKPLLLLSADDIDGQDNVVNYGMWLMWAGDSISVADDDAAYLQAMDFAQKFHQDLMEIQNDTNDPCSVDIYVVRPIIRNPGQEDQELYFLIMNDTPWTTAQ